MSNSRRISLTIVDRPTALLVSSVAPSLPGGGDVLSVFGRTGTVTAQSGDYSAFYDSAGSAATALSTSQAYTINQIAAITPASIGAATAAQGTLAGTALQPGAIGTTVQGYSAVTAAIAALPATANRVFGRDGSGNIALITIGGGGDMLKSIYDTTDNGIVDAAEEVPWTGVTGKPTFATVATSGAYADLSGLPSIPNSPDDIGAQPEDDDLTGLAALATTGLVNRTGAGTFTTVDPSSYETAGTAAAAIVTHVGLSDPHGQYALESALGAVAFSNAYSDLTGLPSIPNSPDDIGAQPEDADLTALAALATTGLVNRTGAGTFTTVATDAYDAAGTAASEIATHVGLSDPHTQYALESALGATAFSNAYSDLSGLPSIPDSPDDIGAQPEDADLTAIAAISATGLLNRTGAGTFATITVGTAANNIFQLDGSARIPAVNGSLLTGLVFSQIGSTPTTLAGYGITDAVPTTRTLTAGTGIATIGDLSANRTVALSAGSIASLALADTAVQPAAIAGRGQLALFQETTASGANGGTFTAGSDQQRVLNTTAVAQSWASLSSGDISITAPAEGLNLYIEFGCVGYACNRFQSRLSKTAGTGSFTTQLGLTTRSAVTGANVMESPGFATVILTSGQTLTLRLDAQCEDTRASDGLGLGHSFGRSNVFARVGLLRI